MRGLLAARRNGTDGGLVGLTFDDGYTDFREHALPVLARFGFTATVFVIADLLGGANYWDQPGLRKTLMTAEEIRHIAACGMEIGSHGRRHVSLTSLVGDDLVAEVAGSRAILQYLSGQDVSGFCYPYGHVDALAVNAVRAAGYLYGCAIWRAKLRGSTQPDVRFVPPVTDPRPWYAAADVVVLPSRWEGLPPPCSRRWPTVLRWWSPTSPASRRR